MVIKQWVTETLLHRDTEYETMRYVTRWPCVTETMRLWPWAIQTMWHTVCVTLRLCDIETMRYTDTQSMIHTDSETVRLRVIEKQEPWSHKTMRPCDTMTMSRKTMGHIGYLTYRPWDHETMRSWDYWTYRLWAIETMRLWRWDSVSQGPEDVEIRRPRDHETMWLCDT